MNPITTRLSGKNILFSTVFFVSFSLLNNVVIAQNEHKHASESVEATIENLDSSTKTEAVAADKHADPSEEKFNTQELIMEHIADAHDWHLWGHTSIHLPIILYTNKGFEFFSSGKFDHGHATHQGAHYNYRIIKNPGEQKENIKVVDATGNIDESISVIDLSITKNIASLLLSVILLLLIFISIANGYKKRGIGAPKGLAAWLEPIVIFVRDDIARPNLGENYARFMPYLLTVFFFIWMNNVLGLVPFFPGGANVTGNIAVTLVLAVITFILTNINGTKTYWGHIFSPHVPKWLWPLMIPVEIIGLFTKPFALMIRLFANITAGHILILSLVCLIFIFKSLAVAGISVPFIVFISVIEMVVAFIQAFIFTILSALYIGMALEKPQHDDHH
jgi:F-type H+-transporting ATPase subunit a